jgi:tRNA-2-methylthio-N6-dimethylallyladenosine synthase
MARKYFIRTFGCQMNEHDSDRMCQLLTQNGWMETADPMMADWIIINTCSVRAKPEHKALSEAGRYQRARKKRGVRIMVAGCVAQQEGKKLLEHAPYLDAVVGPDEIGRIPELVEKVMEGKGPVVAVELHGLSDPMFVPLCARGPGKISRLLTIMKGCNNGCAYCVVPNVRGREVSRPARDILHEAESLASQGCREITLLGQNVNSYRDAEGTDFPDLLDALDRQGAVERIRFTTSHPKDLSPKLVEAMAGLERVCEHLHLALQSGSSRVLERMRRGYTRGEFLKKAAWLRSAVSGIRITTDIIVGFPGEDNSDFMDTLSAVEEVGFEQAYSFKYSKRPNTPANSFPDDVPEEVKSDRLLVLQSKLNEVETASLRRRVGSLDEVMVEGMSVRDGDSWMGRTRGNLVVNFDAVSPLSPGRIIDVKILEARGHTLWGKLESAASNTVDKSV